LSEIGRSEALAAARKLLRGFSAAPDARQHAHKLHSELARAHGWSPAEEARILALGAWLQTRPDLTLLKSQCSAILAKL
jgi:hypothetical protein